jgi:hypothetical protein
VSNAAEINCLELMFLVIWGINKKVNKIFLRKMFGPE